MPEKSVGPGAMLSDSGWAGLCRIGGVAAFVFFAYSLATIVQVVVLGGPPTTAVEAFELLNGNRIIGLLRLDLPTVLVMPLYYLIFLAIFAALRPVDCAYAALSAVLGVVGVTLVLAMPTALPLIPLSEKYAAATSPAARTQLETVGEAILATDIWHGSGSFMGGILAQSGAILICAIMLRSNVFSKAIAYSGVVTHGLDLAHILAGPFSSTASVVLMAIAGPLYLVWLPLIGRRLLQLSRIEGSNPASPPRLSPC